MLMEDEVCLLQTVLFMKIQVFLQMDQGSFVEDVGFFYAGASEVEEL